MHMFRTIGFFAAFLAVAYAAPTPTQSACSNELSVIGHAHDAAEQIQKNLFAMQGNYNGQPPPESVFSHIRGAHSVVNEILGLTTVDNGRPVGSVRTSGTPVTKEGVVSASIGVARLFRRAIEATDPSQTCVKERAILVRVQDLAGQLHGKMVDLQNGGSDQGPTFGPVVDQIISALEQLLNALSNTLADVGGAVGGVVGGGIDEPTTVLGSLETTAGGVSGGVAPGAFGTVGEGPGGVVGGVTSVPGEVVGVVAGRV